jgi:ribonuclease P protein subunit RPR2
MARRNKGEERELAMARIRRLFRLAEDAQRAEQSSTRYVELARRIAMRYQVSLPVEIRRRVCRGCGSLLTPGRSARHRVSNGRISVTCLGCGNIKRYPLSPRKVTA